MNSADDDEVDPPKPVTGISTQIIDYYNRFGQNRDLEQYFSLTSATGETVDPASLLIIPSTFSNTVPSTSGLTSCKQTNHKSAAEQIDSVNDDVKNSPIKESDYEKIKLSEDSEASKEASGLCFDNSLTKAPSPTSSITSQRKLEWDSLADVGYPSDIKTTDIELCTLERMALQQYTDSEKSLHVKFMPLPTAQSTPVDDVPAKTHKLKRKVKKQTIADNSESSTSKVEIQSANNFPGNINVNVTKNISLNLFGDNPNRNDTESTNKNIPLVSTIEHTNNNVNPVELDKIDREIQTSLRIDTPKVPNEFPVEYKFDAKGKMDKFPGPIIVNIQKMKYPVYTKSNWRTRSNLHRKRSKFQKEKIGTRIPAQLIEPITEEMITPPGLKDNDAQLSNADSFEYMSGQLYTQATNKKVAKDLLKTEVDKTTTSESERKLSTTSTTSDSSKSFKRDLEGSIELLSNLLEQRHKNSDLKKRLIKKVVDKLLNANYPSDKSTSQLNENSSRSTVSNGDKSGSSKINESSVKPILKRQNSQISSHSAPEPLILQKVNEFVKKPFSTYSLDIESRSKQNQSNKLPSFSSEELIFGAKSPENSTPATDSSKVKSLDEDGLKCGKPFDKHLHPTSNPLNTGCQKSKTDVNDVDRLMEDLISVKLDGGGDVGDQPKVPKHHTVFTLTDLNRIDQPSTSQKQLPNQVTYKEKMNVFFQRYKPGGNFSFYEESTPGTGTLTPQTHFCCCPYHQPENCNLGQNWICTNTRDIPHDCGNFPDQFVLLPTDTQKNLEYVGNGVDCYHREKSKIGECEMEQRTVCYNGSELYLTSASASTSNLNSGRKVCHDVDLMTQVCLPKEEPTYAANKVKRSEGTIQFSTATDISKTTEKETRCSRDTSSTRRRCTSPPKTYDKNKSSKLTQECNKKKTDPLKKSDECPNNLISLQKETKSSEKTPATKPVKKKYKEKVRSAEHNIVKTTAKKSPRRCKAMQTMLSINPKVTEPKLSDINMVTSNSPSTSPSSFAKSGKSVSNDGALCTCKTCDKCGRTKHNAENHCPALETCSKLLLEAQKFDEKQMENSQRSANVQHKGLQTHYDTATHQTQSPSIHTKSVLTSYSSQFDNDSTARTFQESPTQIKKKDKQTQKQNDECPTCGNIHSPSNSVDTNKTKNSSGDDSRSSIKNIDSQGRRFALAQSDICPICGKVHSSDTPVIHNDNYREDGKIPKSTQKSTQDTVQTKKMKPVTAKETCRKCGKIHDDYSQLKPVYSNRKHPIVRKPIKTMKNSFSNRRVADEAHQTVLDSSKDTSTSKSKSDTDAARVTSNRKLKSTEHDILMDTIKSIINRYSKITSDDESSQRNSKRKTRKEILHELRYLLNTHMDDTHQNHSNNNENNHLKGESSGSKSKEQTPSPLVNSTRRTFKPHTHKIQFYEESTDQSPSSPSDSYTRKLFSHFRKEYDKLLRKHCNCENCNLSYNVDSNENIETCCRKTKRHPKVLKKNIAYNLIIQSSDSFDIDQDDTKPKSRLEEVVIKIPKNSRLIPRVASDSRIDYDDLSSGRQKVCRSDNNKHVMLLEMKPEYVRNDGRSESRTHSEAPRSKDIDQEISVQRYLEINRPDFLSNTERRQDTIKEIQNERINRAKIKRMLVSMQLSEAGNVNMLTLDDMKALAKEVGLRPSRSVSNEKLTMERKMKQHSEKIYNKLPEVTRKKEQMKKEQIKKTNLIMQQIFNKSLQKKTLRGQVDVPHCSSIIKI